MCGSTTICINLLKRVVCEFHFVNEEFFVDCTETYSMKPSPDGSGI